MGGHQALAGRIPHRQGAAPMDTAHQPHIPAESGAAITACLAARPGQGH